MQKRIKKIIISCLLLCLFLLSALCACKKERHPLYSKYYLEGSQDVYIEIIDSEYLQFVGVDYSFVDPETFWGEDFPLDKDIDISACMQGLKKYIFWVDNDITVEVIEGSGLTLGMQYDGSKTIRFNEIIYILG